MSSEVVCMSLAEVPAGEQRSRFLAVGLLDRTVRIVSLDPTDCLAPLSMQALPATPTSLAILEMGGDESGSLLYLNIGLEVSGFFFLPGPAAVQCVSSRMVCS